MSSETYGVIFVEVYSMEGITFLYDNGFSSISPHLDLTVTGINSLRVRITVSSIF